MSTVFPGTDIDTFTDVATAGIILAATTNNMQDPISAIEIKLGVDSSAVATTIDYLLKSDSSTDPGHLHSSSGISGQIAVAQGGTGSATASAARTALGVAIGTNVQAYDADLDALAAGTWAGTSSITTLGTIGTGVWNGTVVADGYGGTGQSTYAAGDILYASAVDTVAKLAKGTLAEVLTVDAGGLPSWAVPAGGADEKVKISSDDTTADYLLNKLVAGSTYLTLVETGGGGDEDITIDIANIIKTDAIGTITVTENTDAALTVNQLGTGDIFDFKSNGISILKGEAARTGVTTYMDIDTGPTNVPNVLRIGPSVMTGGGSILEVKTQTSANIFAISTALASGTITMSANSTIVSSTAASWKWYAGFTLSDAAGVGVTFENKTIDTVGRSAAIYLDKNGSGQGDLAILDANEISILKGLSAGQLLLGTQSLSIGATVGFPYMPAMAGAPTDVPTTITGACAFHYDTTNNDFYVYNSTGTPAWKKVSLT